MIVTCFLTIGRRDSGRYYTPRNPVDLRLTRDKPALKGTEIALKVSIDIPDSIFNRPVPALDIKIPEDLLANPDAEVVTNITAHEVANALKLDVQTVHDGLKDMLERAKENEART